MHPDDHRELPRGGSTGPTPPPGAPPLAGHAPRIPAKHRRSRHPWPWIAATGVLAVISVTATLAAFATHRSADDWRTQAEIEAQRAASWQTAAGSLTDQAAALEADRDTLTAELAAVAAALDTSETDVADLETRLAELAAEEAAAQDAATVAQIERDAILSVATNAAGVLEATNACIDAGSRLADLARQANNGVTFNATQLDQFIAAYNQTCSNAAALGQQVVDTVNGW